MPRDQTFAIIGAGLAGLTCARTLADAGHAVTVFDKGRGLGGRMASRRKDDWRFDHGAIALRPTDAAFAAFVSHSSAQGHAARWDAAQGWTGLPGMSGTVKPCAEGLNIHNEAEVTAMKRGPGGWSLHGPKQAEGLSFDRVILAIPQPQAHRLLTPWPALQAQIAGAEMAPCWTLMAGFTTHLPTDLTYMTHDTGALCVIARETAKPGRALPGDGWVIQASGAWSRQHLEWDRADVEPPLLEAFFAALGCAPVTPEITMAHRWRYALTSKPLGHAYLTDAALGLSLCGDWCLGPTAQDAFKSGHALATTLAAQS